MKSKSSRWRLNSYVIQEECKIKSSVLLECKEKDIHKLIIFPKSSISEIEFHNEINEEVFHT